MQKRWHETAWGRWCIFWTAPCGGFATIMETVTRIYLVLAAVFLMTFGTAAVICAIMEGGQ